MAGLGGAIKLKGESEYKRALTQIKQNLREVSSEMKAVSSSFDKGDNSTSALNAKSQVLNKTLEAQKQKLETLKSQYSDFSAKMAQQTANHDKLVNTYNEEKQKLEEIGNTLGKSSKEYKEQQKKVEDLSNEVAKSQKNQDANNKSLSDMRVEMNNTQAAINKTELEIKQYNSEIEKMKSGQKQAESATEKLNDKINDQSDRLKSLKKAYADSVLETGKHSKESKDLSRQISELSGELKKNEVALSNAESAADRFDKSLDDAGNGASQASGGFTVMKGVLANLAGNVLSTVVSGIQNLAGEAMNSADALTKFESTMDFAGYNGSQIKKAKADMKEYADRTVYDLNTISNTTAQLAANGIPNYEKLTEAAGNLNAVAGGNSETFKSVAMMLTQTAGAGKLTTENWNQMADAIPGASGKVQEALKKNGAYTGNFRDAMAEGQITADEFNKAIMDLGFTDAAEQAATSTDTFEGAVGNLQAAVVDGLMEIYEAIGPENVTGFINGITDFVSAAIPPIKKVVGWFIDNLPKIAPMLAGIAGGLTALLIADQIQKMAKAFDRWKEATEGETIAQKLLNEVQNANTIGLVIAGIVALVSAFIYLWNTSESFRNFWIGLWEGIKTVTGTIVNAIGGFFTETLPNFITTAVSFFSELPGNIGNFLGQALSAVGQWVVNMVQKAVELGSQFVQNVVSFFSRLPGNIWNFLASVISNVSIWVVNMASKAREGGAQFLLNAVNFISQLPGYVARFMANIISNLGSWVGNMARKGAEGARSLYNAVVNGLRSLPSEMFSWGKDMIQGLVNGIKSMIGAVGDAVKGVANKIKSFLHFSRPDEGPLREYEEWMPDMISGMSKSLEESSPALINQTKALASGMSDALQIDGSIKGTVSGQGSFDVMVSAFKQALKEMKIEMDGDEMGKFVDKTVTKLVYA